MKKLTPILVTAISLLPTITSAQGIVPTLENGFEFCQDRPLEPEWMTELPSREKYKRLVIQTIYRAQGLERVVDAQECSCGTRFPPWDTAVQHFNDNFLNADRNALREAEEEHLNRFNDLRSTARTICEAEGNW